MATDDKRNGPAGLSRKARATVGVIARTVAQSRHQLTVLLAFRGDELRKRFVRTGSLADLDKAIDYLQLAADTSASDYPYRAVILMSCAGARWNRFAHTDSPADLNEALRVSRLAVAAKHAEHLDDFHTLLLVAATLKLRSEQITADQNAAIAAYRHATQVLPTDHPGRPAMLIELSGALWSRFSQSDSLPDLDEALQVSRLAITAVPSDYPDRARMWWVVAEALRIRFERTGTMADLDELIRTGRQAVTSAPIDDTRRAQVLSNLGRALRTRSERTDSAADLNEAVDCLRQAVDGPADDNLDRAAAQLDLGAALWHRLAQTDAIEDLEEIIRASRQALTAMSAGLPGHAVLLSITSKALAMRFERTGTIADLDEAVRLGRQALPAISEGDSALADCYDRLCEILVNRFRRTGLLSDLDEAVEVARLAVTAFAADSPDQARLLFGLGVALRIRFERTQAMTDIDEAVEAARRAVAATPADHPHFGNRSSSLGRALVNRSERTGKAADLDEGIRLIRRAVDATRPDHRERVNRLTTLGLALQRRFQRTRSTADLDEAIDILREAVATSPIDSSTRAIHLFNFGNSLMTRFQRAEAIADLDEATVVLREAIAATPTDHPDRVLMLTTLGIALVARFDWQGTTADREERLAAAQEAIAVLEAAAGLDVATPSHRIRAARAGAMIVAESEPGRAAALLERATRLLPETAPRRLARADQQHVLEGNTGLAADAAALALQDPEVPADERPATALRLLEAGRNVLLSQALEVGSDLTELTDRYPDLAREFDRLRGLLDRTPDPGILPTEPAPDRHRLAVEFDTVLTRIRSCPGFESFAQPPTMDELVAQAGQGPIVVFNISRYRSDALLLTTGGITCVPLPGLSSQSVEQQVATFREAVRTAGHGATGADRRAAQQQIHQVLEWLWDNATGPALDALGYRGRLGADRTGPRVWWVPGGLLAQLPLHAAGYHADGSDPAPRTVMDRVVSSYTPTVAALRHARRRLRAPAPAAPRRALIVAMPTTPGVRGRLSHVPDEVRMLADRLPRTVVLAEPDPDIGSAQGDSAATASALPTRAAVLRLLTECGIVHFACHGTSDPDDPSRSHLLLHDHDTAPLTVAALAPVHLDHAQLAYLSACDTAWSRDSRLLDEAIHLTSAFQLAGYPHVIGTLWTIDDEIAVQVADEFYTTLRIADGEVGHAAYALHRAVRAARDTVPATPSLWAAFLHAGA